jgi:hypothetical protein
VAWPTSVNSAAFPRFLDTIARNMQAKPTDSTDGVDLDHAQIEADLLHFNNINIHMPIQERLQQFILLKQKSITTGLTIDRHGRLPKIQSTQRHGNTRTPTIPEARFHTQPWPR